jgi:hypothetical protein
MKWVTDGEFTFNPTGSAPSVTICCTSHGIGGDPFAEFKKVTTCTPKDANGNPSPEYDCLPDNPNLNITGYFDALTVSGYSDPPFCVTGTTGTFTYVGGNSYAGSCTVKSWADEAAESAEQGFRFAFVVTSYTET